MAILEVIISYKMKELFIRKYYDSDLVIHKQYREGLLEGIRTIGLSFQDSVNSFSLGEYKVVLITQDIDPFEDIADAKEQLHIYCIVNINTEVEMIRDLMKTALFQFTNRYSSFDIYSNKKKLFKEFKPRIDQLFGDLSYKSEDRFRSVFG